VDFEITRRLREIRELAAVRVFDHVIIGKGRPRRCERLAA